MRAVLRVAGLGWPKKWTNKSNILFHPYAIFRIPAMLSKRYFYLHLRIWTSKFLHLSGAILSSAALIFLWRGIIHFFVFVKISASASDRTWNFVIETKAKWKKLAKNFCWKQVLHHVRRSHKVFHNFFPSRPSIKGIRRCFWNHSF